MRRAAFLDRDGTIIHDPGYLGDPAGVALLPGAAAAIAALRGAGYRIVVISNQSGVARGLFGEDAVQAVNRRMDELLRAEAPEAGIDAVYYCPHGPGGGCDCRKPLPGLFLRAAGELGLDLGASLAVGDSARDVEAALAAGVRRAQQIGAPPLPATLLEAARLLLGGAGAAPSE